MNKDEENQILNLFTKNRSITLGEISKKLSWSIKFKKKNRENLDQLVNLGQLVLISKGRYNTPENLGYIIGKLNIIKNKFAFIDSDKNSMFIPKSNFNGALNGDLVMAKISLKNSIGEKESGEVVKILKRLTSIITGVYKSNDKFGFVIANHTLGSDIFIPKKFRGGAKSSELVVCKIVSWGKAGKNPEGEIIEIIGDAFNSDNMIHALIIREGLSESFSPTLLKEAQQIEENLNKNEINKRHDLRTFPIITIDGEDAKDLDDAVYVEILKNSNFKLIVCIADVSHYIPYGSDLDLEARKRGNSVYLVDRVIPMFPREISNGLCSLNPNEDKFVFTCEMEIDQQGSVISHKIYKAIISTKYRMTYSDVNKILDKDTAITEKYIDINQMIFQMLELSTILCSFKQSRGSIDFDVPELKTILDENNRVKHIKLIEQGKSEKIIEDFMIAANETIAENVFNAKFPFIYRTHDKPDPEKIKMLNKSILKFGYSIPSHQGLHPEEIQKIIEISKKDGNSLIIHKLILMSLKQARYSVDNTGHFGLSSNYYTHFTSPIRRYADLMVHRVLNEKIKEYPSKKKLTTMKNELPDIATHISKTERSAMKIESESVKLKIVEYMLEKIGEIYRGKIIGFSKTLIFFQTEEYVEVFFNVVNCPNYFVFDEINYQMINENSKEIFQLGDVHDISIVRADLINLEIEVIPTIYLKYYKNSK